MSRMAVTRYLALAFMFVATATAQDDFWPPFQVLLNYICTFVSLIFFLFQEEWRCLGEDDGKLYDWVDDSPEWVEETHHLITYVDNPEGQAAIDFDCPVIDPTDTATWCPQGIDYYPVPCKYSDHIQMYLMYSAKNFIDNLTLQQKTKKSASLLACVIKFSMKSLKS